MTSYLTLSKMPFTDEDGHLIRAFQKEKHDTASQLLNKFANVHKQSSWLNRFQKTLFCLLQWTSPNLIGATENAGVEMHDVPCIHNCNGQNVRRPKKNSHMLQGKHFKSSFTIWQCCIQPAPVSVSSEPFHGRAHGSIRSAWSDRRQQQQQRRGCGDWGANSDRV